MSQLLSSLLVEEEEKEERVECEQCGKTFQHREMLDTHMEILHSEARGPTSKPFSCRFCTATFAFSVNVERHMLLVHPGAKQQESKEEGADQDDPVFTMEQDEEVESGAGPSREQQQQQQFPAVEKFRCNICGEYQKSKRYLVAHIQSHYGGGYTCDYPGCTAVFKENAKLKRHKLVHTGVKAFKCAHCGQSFSLRHNLKMHEKTHTS